MEVAVVAGRVEMGNAAGVLDGWEYAATLFGADLLAGRGEVLDRRRRIGGDGC